MQISTITVAEFIYLRTQSPNHESRFHGHCVPWCTAAVGAVAGGLGSIIFQKISDPHGSINWKQVGAAVVGGAVAGGHWAFWLHPQR
jgi:hypothetical protein